MNINTNELFDVDQATPELKKLFETDNNFRRVPENLQEEAKHQLDSAAEKIVLNNSPLAKWAKKVRQNIKNGNEAR